MVREHSPSINSGMRSTDTMLELPAVRLPPSKDRPIRSPGRMLVGRVLEAHPMLAGELTTDEEMAAGVVAVVTASRSLFIALERDPGRGSDAATGALHERSITPRTKALR